MCRCLSTLRAFGVLLGSLLLLAPGSLALATDAAPTSGPPLTFARPLGEGPVFVVPVDGMIDNALAAYVARAVSDAEAAGASLIVFNIDTFGGLVDAADKIRKTLLDAAVPTVAFIDKNAASAGALISYACDRIVMVPGASIGAATVVEGTGDKASEKAQSYMRGLMRATAEAKGRDPRIAEAMVDERVVIDGIEDTDETLVTLSSEEARRLGVADAIYTSQADLLADLDLESRALTDHHTTRTEDVLRFLANPMVVSVLLLMIMGGLYFEMQSPGFGFAGLMALTGAALFFAPHYLMGLVESWEIIVFVLGVGLLLVELFVLPGFGIAGVSGLVMVFGALLAALVGNVGLSFPDGTQMARATAILAAAIVLTVAFGASMGRYLPRSRRFGRLVLTTEMDSASGYVAAEADTGLLGRRGVALTALRPAGTADLGGQRVDVVSQGAFVTAGQPVEVVAVRGTKVEVREVAATA